MSGIAEVLANLGYRVTGSDVADSANVKRLRDKGIAIAIGHKAENLNAAEVVVVSSAIRRDNPDISESQIAFSVATLKDHGVVDSGDALKLGIGAMTDERWSDFYNTMVKAGVVKAGIDYKKAYTTQFVNKGVGLELRPK